MRARVLACLIAATAVQVSPLWASWVNGTAEASIDGDAPQGALGQSVAGVGDVNGDGYADVVAGAPGSGSQAGMAYLFLGGPAGLAAQSLSSASARLAGEAPGGRFGSAVAGAGDVDGDGYDDVLVGAPGEAAGAGAAYLFRGGPGGIAATSSAGAAARFPGDQPGASFGSSVAGAGDVNGDGYDDVLIGQTLFDAPGKTDAGRAFLYLGGPGGIAGGGPAAAAVRFEGDQADGRLGTVAGGGDVNGDGYDDVLIGASGVETVLIFRGGPGGPSGGRPAAASTRLVLIITHLWEVGSFGAAMAGAGDVNGDGYGDIVLGAGGYFATTGAAFVFHGGPQGIPSGSATSGAQKTITRDFSNATFIGAAVAGAGDVNADGYDDILIGTVSGTFLYAGGPAGVSDMLAILPGPAMAGAGDVNGDGLADLIFGAPGFNTGRGSCRLYLGGTESLRQMFPPATFKLPAVAGGGSGIPVAGSEGIPVAAAGDVNADGFSDFVVGAPAFTNGERSEGAAWVVLGGPSRKFDSAVRLEGNQEAARFGYDVASAGDVNGDGYDDVLVTAPGWDGPEIDEGAAFLFLGGPDGIRPGGPSTAAARIESDQAGASLRFAAGAGDVNGDGYADVLAGAPLYDAPEADEGMVFLFLGGPDGIIGGGPARAAARFESDQPSARLASVSGAGDVNGDGFDDIVLGAYRFSRGEAQEGAAFVFLGGPAGIPGGSVAGASARLESDQKDASFGGSETQRGTAPAGDVDGDGYDDILVTARGYDHVQGWQDIGAVFLYRGGPGGIAGGGPSAAALRMEGDLAFKSNLGWGLGAGDVNGDGSGDVVAGSRRTKLDPNENWVFLFPAGSGRNQAVSQVPVRIGAQLPWLGSWVAGAGDLDADGFADVVAAALVENGAAVLLFGNGERRGRPAVLRQLRGKGAPVPVARGGLSYRAGGFRIEMVVPRHPGRAVRLEVEACPVRAAFGTAACVRALSPAWTEVWSAGAALQASVSGLDRSLPWHWRARVQRVPARALPSGITVSPSPSHGPWRRLGAFGSAMDIRLGRPQQVFVQFVAPRGTAPAGAPASAEVVLTTSDGLPARKTTEVRWETRDGTAVAGRDYVAGSGTLVFPAGTTGGTRRSLTVELLPGVQPEVAFTLRLLGEDGTEWSQSRETVASSHGGSR